MLLGEITVPVVSMQRGLFAKRKKGPLGSSEEGADVRAAFGPA